MIRYINPFPPIGENRIWREEYISERIKQVPELKWKKLGKLVPANIAKLRGNPGLYIFSLNGLLAKLSPNQSSYHSVVYIGKASALKDRLNDYLADKRAVKRFSTSKRKIRDNVKSMFQEYDNELVVYYTYLSPDEIGRIEDILIQIFDPIFNFEQRLKGELFERHESFLNATFVEDGNRAFAVSKEQAVPISENPSSSYILGDEESAF